MLVRSLLLLISYIAALLLASCSNAAPAQTQPPAPSLTPIPYTPTATPQSPTPAPQSPTSTPHAPVPTPLFSLPLPAEITAIAWSADNRTLAVATTNGVALFDTDSREQTGVALLGSPIGRLSFSPDGRALLLFPVDSDTPPVLWDVAAGREAEPFTGKWAGVTAATFAPGSDQVATGSQAGSLTVWDLDSGQPERVFEAAAVAAAMAEGETAGPWPIVDLAYLPGGRTILVQIAGEWTEWLLVDPLDGRLIDRVSPAGHIAGPIAMPLFAPGDDRHIYWLSRASIYKVDLASDQEAGQYHHTDFVLATAFSPDGRFLATLSAATVGDELLPLITLWDLAQGSGRSLPLDLANMPSALAFSPDGTRLAYATSGEGVTILELDLGPAP